MLIKLSLHYLIRFDHLLNLLLRVNFFLDLFEDFSLLLCALQTRLKLVIGQFSVHVEIGNFAVNFVEHPVFNRVDTPMNGDDFLQKILRNLRHGVLVGHDI